MKNDLVDEKYESLESFLSCHLHRKKGEKGSSSTLEEFSTLMIDGNNFIHNRFLNLEEVQSSFVRTLNP